MRYLPGLSYRSSCLPPHPPPQHPPPSAEGQRLLPASLARRGEGGRGLCSGGASLRRACLSCHVLTLPSSFIPLLSIFPSSSLVFQTLLPCRLCFSLLSESFQVPFNISLPLGICFRLSLSPSLDICISASFCSSVFPTPAFWAEKTQATLPRDPSTLGQEPQSREGSLIQPGGRCSCQGWQVSGRRGRENWAGPPGDEERGQRLG